MGQGAGRRRWVPTIVSAVVALALGTTVVVFARERGPEPVPTPDVVLERGTFAGMQWTFGLSDFGDGRSCVELVFDAAGSGCGAFRPPIRALKFYTSSRGDPSGVMTAEGFVAEEVVSVVTIAGGRPVGEAHVVDLPVPVAGKRRAVVAFANEGELDGRRWVAIALDEHSRVVARDVIP